MGKILIVDDKYDDAIAEAIKALMEKGISVQYWNGKGEYPKTIRNIRVVIIDLDLTSLGTRTPGPEFYSPAVKALNKIPGPFLVIIMALDFNRDDPSNLESASGYYNIPIFGFVAKEGLTKEEERENPDLLVNLVTSWVNQKKILNLILLWESVVDRAKDLALTDLTKNEVEGVMVNLIKSICEDLGEDSATRELAGILLRFVSRRINEGEDFGRLANLVCELNRGASPQPSTAQSQQRSVIYNRLMFFKPESGEKPWTGDIYKTEDKYQYAIVLTPACDFAHGETNTARTCFGFPSNENYFQDPEYPPNKFDQKAIQICKTQGKTTFLEFMRSRYLRGRKLPENLYMLWNFSDGDESCLCFDFNHVHSLSLEAIQKWKRVCRLDTPFIDNMLEKYGRQVLRIGTLDINKSPH
jgi:hypothetical protein